MKHTLTLLALLPLSLFGQTIWPVAVGGSSIGSTQPYYSPSSLTINVGDIVRWTNATGTHNVNGSLSIFPSNPQGFNSGDPQSGNWSYQFTFTIPGTYTYHCTSEGHAATQTGTIIVNNTTSVAEVGTAEGVKLYPVPTSNVLTLETEVAVQPAVRIVDLDGATVLVSAVNTTGRTDIDVSSLAAGKYFVLITDAKGAISTKPFTKN